MYNPQPKERPTQLDFCWVIPMRGGSLQQRAGMPARPIPLRESGFDLSQYHAAKLEHVPGAYRLYHYGDAARGVFRGTAKNGLVLVTESIPMEEEWARFAGLLVYAVDEYEQAVKRWENYWTWVENRNEQRWISQEAGQVDYDLKNMMHCLRLMMSCESILRSGTPRVRFEGADREFLMDVRRGKFSYEQLMESVEERMRTLEALYESGSGAGAIPYEVDRAAIDELFARVIAMPA